MAVLLQAVLPLLLLLVVVLVLLLVALRQSLNLFLPEQLNPRQW